MTRRLMEKIVAEPECANSNQRLGVGKRDSYVAEERAPLAPLPSYTLFGAGIDITYSTIT